MKIQRFSSAACLVTVLSMASFGSTLVTAPRAQGQGLDLILSSGGIVLNENDIALADNFVNIPLVVGARYHLSRIFAVEGEFSYLLPIKQQIDLGSAGNVDRKTPDMLTYQASLIAKLPLESALTPYAVAGLGAMTFLSNTGADRSPQVEKTETRFAMNFGAGLTLQLTSDWLLMGEYRGLVGYPSDKVAAFASNGESDPLWMERATVGIGYRF